MKVTDDVSWPDTFICMRMPSPTPVGSVHTAKVWLNCAGLMSHPVTTPVEGFVNDTVVTFANPNELPTMVTLAVPLVGPLVGE